MCNGESSRPRTEISEDDVGTILTKIGREVEL